MVSCLNCAGDGSCACQVRHYDAHVPQLQLPQAYWYFLCMTLSSGISSKKVFSKAALPAAPTSYIGTRTHMREGPWRGLGGESGGQIRGPRGCSCSQETHEDECQLIWYSMQYSRVLAEYYYCLS